MIVAKHLTATAPHKLYTVDVGNIDCIPRLITFGLGLPTSRNLHQDDVLKIEIIYVKLCFKMFTMWCSMDMPLFQTTSNEHIDCKILDASSSQR